MLLAQPMPMSGEERQFVFSHKSVQRLNDWTYDDYKDYVASPIGRQIVFSEGQRWIGIMAMIRAQSRFAAAFVAGRVKAPKPLPHRPERSGSDAGASGDAEAAGREMQPGVAGGSAPGASAGYSGDDDGGSTTMNLRENLGDNELFLKSADQLNGKDSEVMFKKLRSLRADISKYCKQLDDATRKAKSMGMEQALKNAMNSVIWD